MSEKLAVITCTADRPEAFRACKHWMLRMYRRPDIWLIVDSGKRNVHVGEVGIPTFVDQIEPSQPGIQNFLKNLSRGLDMVPRGWSVSFMEDDDWYAPDHLEKAEKAISEGAHAVGCNELRYWHRGAKRAMYHKMRSICSLASTTITHAMMPALRYAIESCWEKNDKGVDRHFWRQIEDGAYLESTNVGIKGWPGPPNIGIGRNPEGPRWHHDQDGSRLRNWVGHEDARRIMYA